MRNESLRTALFVSSVSVLSRPAAANAGLPVGLRWKAIQHVIDVSVELLGVLFIVGAQGVVRALAAPYELMGAGVIHVQKDRADRNLGDRGLGLTPAAAPSTPSAPPDGTIW